MNKKIINPKKTKNKTIFELLNSQSTLINNQTTTNNNSQSKVSELLNYPTTNKTTELLSTVNDSPQTQIKNSISNILIANEQK
jgi:hypothetical protein